MAGSEGDSESDSELSDGSRDNAGVVRRVKERPQPSVHDASIKMWDFRRSEGE